MSVFNRHNQRPEFGLDDVYIGRPSIFGNPFVIGRDGTREEVIAKYASYAKERMYNDSEFRKAVLQLKGKRLWCWCAPEACHGDILELILQDWALEQGG